MRRVRIIWGDLCDQALMERALGENEVATVIHLAAQAIVGTANRNSVSTFASNIGGTCALLEASHRCSTVNQVVVASSDKAYGEQAQLPYTEATSLDPLHPYDVSKACADLIARSYAHTFELPVAITRCGNFYGPGDMNWNRIVPGTIRSLVRGERPLIRSDGGFVRDYFYVEDGAAAYMLLAERLAAQPELSGEAFNFSTEEPLTVLQLVSRILSRMESRVRPVIRNEACHEIRRQYLSAAKARNVLGWKPQFPLDDGLERTIQWYRQFLTQNRQAA